MSFSRSSRLSRKRKNEDSQPESSQFDITVDDFQENGPVFRLPPKRHKQDKVPDTRRRTKNGETDKEITNDTVSKKDNSKKKKNTEEISDGKKASSSKEETNESQSKESENSLVDLDDDLLFKKPNLTSKWHKKSRHTSNKNSKDIESTNSRNDKNEVISSHIDDADKEKDKELLELEKSICTSYEKLCVCCKHIVPSSVYADHLKDCMQKFKHNTRATRSSANTESSEGDSKTVKEVGNEVGLRKEPSDAKKCQICSKVFKYPSERIGHVRGCALKHGITIEELNNQAKGKKIDTVNQNKVDKVKKSRSKKASNSALAKDPDLAIALALSRSLAEEEADKRSHEEEKLLALGCDDIVQEDRSKRPIVVLKPPTDQKSQKEKSSKRKKRGVRNETVLMQRSTSERERIISEKVAMLLAVDDHPVPTWDPQENFISKHCLAAFQDKSCSLWESSHCTADDPLDKFYVQDLVTHIKPQKIEVGGLFKRLSQIPGRLNATASLEDSDSDDGYQELDAECSVAEAYRTQLILAELMGSQEGLDSTVDGLDYGVETNVSQTSTTGFLPMQNKNKENESYTNNSKIDELPEKNKNRVVNNYISNNVENEIHNDKDSPSPPPSPPKVRELGLNESDCNDGSRNLTLQMNEDGKTHSESKINKTNKDSPLSPIKKSLTAMPSINQETDVIVLDDDDDDDDDNDNDKNPKLELDRDIHLRSNKDHSPNTGWITKSKENNSFYKSKSPYENCRYMGNSRSPRNKTPSFIEKSKINSRESVISNDFNTSPKGNKTDTSNLDLTNLLLEAIDKNAIQISDSPEKLDSDDEIIINKDQVQNKNSNSNTESSEITPKRDFLLKKKPLNKKLFSTFNQVSIDDDESQIKASDGKQISSNIGNEVVKKSNVFSDNKTIVNKETIIDNQRENTLNDVSSDKSASSLSSLDLQNGKDFDNDNCISIQDSREKMKEKVISDWGSLFENGDEVDTQIITKGGKILKCHSLVFFVRCKQLFKELKIMDANSYSIKSSDWQEIPYEVAYKFILYLYTGKCENLTKSDSMWSSLIKLGTKYKTYALLDYLESLKESIQKNNEKSVEYKNQLSNENVDKDLTHKKDSVIQSVNQSISCNSPPQRYTPRNSFLSNSKSIKDVTGIDGSQSPDLFDDDVDEELFNCCEEGEDNSNNKPECKDLALEKTLAFKTLAHISRECSNQLKPNDLSINQKSFNHSPKNDEVASAKFKEKDLSLQNFSSPDSEEIMEIEQSPRRKSPSNEMDNENDIPDLEPHLEVENKVEKDVIDLTLGSEPESSNSSIGSSHRDPVSKVTDNLNDDGTAEAMQTSGEFNNLDSCNPISNASPNHSSSILMKHAETEGSRLKNLNKSSVKKAHTLSFQDTSGDVDFFDEDTEDMEPLVLGGETSNSEADDPALIDINQENVNEKLSENQLHEEANEIFCAEDAVDNENENSFIDNVWDDFDDMGMGCEMAAAYVPSPIKAQNLQETETSCAENNKNNSVVDSNFRKDEVEANTEESFVLQLNDDDDYNDEMCKTRKSITDCHEINTKVIKKANLNEEENSFELPEVDDFLVSDVNENLSGKSSVSDNTLLKAVDEAETCDWNSDMTMAEDTREKKSHTNIEKARQTNKHKNVKDKFKSPVAHRKKSIQITPRPDYKNMITPELKKELTKYGIRPISKNKAVQLLTHVYEQTHPVVTDSEAETSYCETPPARPKSPEPKKGCKKNGDNILRKKVLTKMQQSTTSSQSTLQKKISNKIQISSKPSYSQRNLEEEKEESPNLSQDSDSSDGSDIGCAEETILMPEKNEEENQDELLTLTQQGDLQSRVSEFIKHDGDLRMKVLLYEPIWIRELQANLKLSGIKCSMAVLMDILDQQCVTFRSEKVQKQGRGRTRKKPK